MNELPHKISKIPIQQDWAVHNWPTDSGRNCVTIKEVKKGRPTQLTSSILFGARQCINKLKHFDAATSLWQIVL